MQQYFFNKRLSADVFERTGARARLPGMPTGKAATKRIADEQRLVKTELDLAQLAPALLISVVAASKIGKQSFSVLWMEKADTREHAKITHGGRRFAQKCFPETLPA